VSTVDVPYLNDTKCPTVIYNRVLALCYANYYAEKCLKRTYLLIIIFRAQVRKYYFNLECIDLNDIQAE